MKYTIEQRIQDKEYDKIINFKDYKNEVLYDPEIDEYFSDIDEMESYYEDYEDEKMPRYAYGCEFIPIQADAGWILDCIDDEHAEGVRDSIVGFEELEEAIDKFNKANEEAMVGSYYENSRIIVELI